MHIFHQYASTFKAPEGLSLAISSLERRVASLMKQCRDAHADPCQVTDAIGKLLRKLRDSDDSHTFAGYVKSKMWKELRAERPETTPGQFIAVTITGRKPKDLKVVEVRAEDPPRDGAEFADLARVGVPQPLTFTENPNEALNAKVLEALDCVNRLASLIDPRTKSQSRTLKFRMNMKRRDRLQWASELRGSVHDCEASILGATPQASSSLSSVGTRSQFWRYFRPANLWRRLSCKFSKSP